MHSSRKDKIEARCDVEVEKFNSSGASKHRDIFVDTLNISSFEEFSCQILVSSSQINEVPPSNQDSVHVPYQFPVLTKQEHLNILYTSPSHPYCHITSSFRPLCASITSSSINPSIHQISYDQCLESVQEKKESEIIKSECFHAPDLVAFNPCNLHNTTDGTFQNNLNHAHQTQQEFFKFYPVLFCRGPNGGLEPIQLYTAYQPCCINQHYHHQPHQQQDINLPPCNHHHHHFEHNESDKNCPIHGHQTQNSHDSVGVTQQSLLTSSLQASSSILINSASVSCALTSASSSTFVQAGRINCSGALNQGPLTRFHSIGISHKLDTPIRDETSVIMETPMGETNQHHEEHGLPLDEDGVSNDNQDDLVDGGDDDEEKEMNETQLEVIQGDDDDDDDGGGGGGVYPASHTPPERDNFQEDQGNETESSKNRKDFGGMAFTIDFGNDKDKPEITENWKKFVPYKLHAGIKERQEEQKRRRLSKELAAEEKKLEEMKKSRSHSGYMSEGHDASSVISTDIDDASICSDFYFQRGPHYSSPKCILAKDKRPTSRFSTPTNQISSQSKKIIKSAPTTKSTIHSGIRQAPPLTAIKSQLKNTKSCHPSLVKGSKDAPIVLKQKIKSVESTRLSRMSSQKRDGVESSLDASVEGTAYLIKKMLNDIPSSTAKTLGSPGITRRLKLGMRQARDMEGVDDNEDDGNAKPPSESGTYTIDEDDEEGDNAGEVIKARKKIDETFGVVCKLPVIDDGAPVKRTPSNKKSTADLVQKRKTNKIDADVSWDQMNVSNSQDYEKAISPTDDDKKDGQEIPLSSMEREDSFEKLMNETSSRLNALIDATSRVIRDAKFSTKTDSQISSSTFVRPSKSKTSTSTKDGSEDVLKDPSPDESGFYAVLCDAPATRKTRSISSSCETGSVGTKSPSDLHLSSHSVSRACSGAALKDITSIVSRRGKSADVKSTTREVSKSRDIFNATPTTSGNVDRKITKKFVAPFAKSLSNVNQASPREGTTFIRDVALIRDMVENTSGGSTRVRSALNRQPSATSPSVTQTSMRINRTFALRCSKAAPTGAAEVPGRSLSSGRHPSRSRSVGNEEGARMKSRESSRSRSDSQKQTHAVDDSSRQRRSSGATQERDVSAFARRDGGRFSMRLEKPDTKFSDVNLAPSNAWQRRKNYDPRKSAELSRSRSSSTRRIDEESDKKSQKDVGRSTSKVRSKVIPGKKLDKIAQMSHAVADNLNALAKNSDLERPVSLKQLPVFTHDSPSSAFSTNTIAKHRPIRSMGGGDNSPEEVSPYDSVLVDSIQQVSKKVKSLADVLIGRMREDPSFEDDSSSTSPNPSDLATVWQSANPELTAILENLKRTELHLQEVHKTLFSDPSEPTSSAGPLPISPHLARKTGFVPIEKPPAEVDEEEFVPRTFTRRVSCATGASKQPLKTSELKKTSNATSAPTNKKKTTPFKSTNHNPLNSDEYY